MSDRSAKLLPEAARNPKPARARDAMRGEEALERASKAIEEMAEKCRNAPRYRDRIAGWPIADLQKLVVGMAKPPWWRFVRRWKWRKLKRNMLKPQPGLRNWLRMATGEEIEAEYPRLRATKSPGDRETGNEETK